MKVVSLKKDEVRRCSRGQQLQGGEVFAIDYLTKKAVVVSEAERQKLLKGELKLPSTRS